MSTDAHTIYREIMREDQGRQEWQIRETAQKVLRHRYDPYAYGYNHRVNIPWALPRNQGISSMGLGGTLPPAGTSSFLTISVELPPVADEKVAQLVVERQIREQLWKERA